MSEDRVVFVSEDEAARLWKRAAELQVEESRRVEERTRALHATPGPSGFPVGQHLPLNEVLAAAREVGIDEECLATAVAELREERASGENPPPDFIERCASRFFGSPPTTLEVGGRIAAPVAEVYHILQRMLPADPYRLRLRNTLGGDPLVDGVLVFDAPEATTSPASYARTVLMAKDRVRRLFVTLRPTEVHGREGCRVTVRARVDADPEPAFWVGSVLTAGSMTTGGALGAAAGIGLGLVGGGLLLVAGGVGLAGGALTYFSYRSRYVRPLVASLAGLRELIEVLQAAVRTGGGFLVADIRRDTDRALPPRVSSEAEGRPVT